MKLLIIFIALLSFASCKVKSDPSFKTPEDAPELKQELSKKTLVQIPDSLILIAGQHLVGDFNGDNEMDFASLVENKNNQKIGVIILHISGNQENFVFGAGKGLII